MIRTITQTVPHTFAEALAKLVAGECFGIRPGKNANFVALYKPAWMNPESPDNLIGWYNPNSDVFESGIRTSQYLEEWYLVVADHRYIKYA